MTVTPPRTSRLDPIIEILLIALLAFMPAAFGTVAAWSEAVAEALGAAIALLLAIRLLTTPASEIRPSLAWLAIVLFIGIAAAQLLPLPMSILRAISPHTAALKTDLLHDLPDANEVLARQPLSFYPLGTRQDLRIVLLATTVFAAVATIYRDDRRIRRLLAAVALIGGAFAVLALAQDLSHTQGVYWRVRTSGGARSGPFFNHSHYGQFMNLSVGCALALLLGRLAEAPRMSIGTLARQTWWLAAVIVLGLATVSLSLTRGGTIAMLVSAAFATAVLLTSRNLHQMAGVVVTLLLAVLAFLFYHGFERVYSRMIEPGVGSRMQMVHDTVAMWRAFPSFGVGLGAYDWIFPIYDRSFAASTAEYVENEYLQALVDTGPIGLAAVLIFVGVIATRYFRAVRNYEDERIGLAAVGLGYGLVAVMLHSVTDFGQHLPAIACLSAVTCGLLFNLGHRRGGRTIRVGRGFGIVAALIVVAMAGWAMIGAARGWRAERHWAEARPLVSVLGRKDWKGPDTEFANLLAAANAAVAAEPDDAHRRYWAAIYRWRWLRMQADPQTQSLPVNDRTVAAAQRIIGDLNEARTRAPTFGLIYTILGQIELNFLNRPVGYDHVQAGYRLSRNDGYAAVVAGEADAGRGNFPAAAERFREAIRIDRSLIDDVIDCYLDEDISRPDLAADPMADDYFALVRLRDALRKEPKWKEVADKVEARAMGVLEAESNQPDAPPWKLAMVGAYHQEQARYDQAEKYLARALQGEPTNVYWRCRRAEVLQKLGRTREAIEEAQLALQQHPDAPEAKAIVKYLTGATP
jgi:tetratricopeptide (TPR) repeat protein